MPISNGIGTARPATFWPATVPLRCFHAVVPSARFTPTRTPQGGALQGTPRAERIWAIDTA